MDDKIIYIIAIIIIMCLIEWRDYLIRKEFKILKKRLKFIEKYAKIISTNSKK